MQIGGVSALLASAKSAPSFESVRKFEKAEKIAPDIADGADYAVW